MRIRGLTLVEMAVVLALVGMLALLLGSLATLGQKTQATAKLLEAQALSQDLLEGMIQDVQSAFPPILVSSPAGFTLQIQRSGSSLCLEYRLNSGQLEQRVWSGSCALPAHVFQDALSPATLPYARFCYDATPPRLVALMDAPCNLGLSGKTLTLRLDEQEFPFPPIVIALRAQ